MALHRRAAKRDKSEAEIIAHLGAYGFSVQPMSAAKAPDLVLGKFGITRVVEVKTGKAALRATQRDWWGAWKGNGLIVLHSPAQVPTLAKYWALLDSNLIPKLAEPRQETKG